jgi:hypothetical protein
MNNDPIPRKLCVVFLYNKFIGVDLLHANTKKPTDLSRLQNLLVTIFSIILSDHSQKDGC